MTTANQVLSVNGQQLSNKDPDLTITLDDHPVVQISSIQEESITYSFLTNVEAEVTYNLNLTFTYKNKYRLVIPMTFVHKVFTDNFVIAPELSELSTTTDHDFTLLFDATLNGTGNAREISLDTANSTLSAGISVVSQAAQSDTQYQVVLNAQSPVEADNTFLFLREGKTTDGKEGSDFAKAVIKLDIKNGINTVTWDPNFKAVGADRNYIPITVVDKDGNPLEGVTISSLNITANPGNGVLNGWSNILVAGDDGQPGSYKIRVDLDHLPGTITVKLVLSFNGTTFTVPDEVFTVPAGSYTVTVDPASVVQDQTVDLSLNIIQARYGDSNHKFTGRITAIESTEDSITVNTATPITITDGVASINVTGKNPSESTIAATAQEYDSNMDVWREAGEIHIYVKTIAAPDIEPEIKDGTTDMTLNLWETKAINYKVMAGETDITSSVTKVTDQTDPNDAIELVKVDDTHWGFQAVKARTDEDLVIDAMVDVYVTYQGTEHVIPMTIDVVVKANTTGIPANRFDVDFV